MSEFHRASRTRVNVFPAGDRYRFREYFEETGLFATLAPYYDDDAYRFDVPEERFESVANALRSFDYEPVIVDDPTPFVVAHRRFRDHPRVLFRTSVERRRTDRYTLFLLKDRASVERAVDAGAITLDELDDINWSVDRSR